MKPNKVTVRISVSEEDMADVKEKLNAVFEKLKEARSLANEVASIMGDISMSISVDSDSDTTDGAN